MPEKIARLRELLTTVEVVSAADLARRWNVSNEAVRQLMNHPEAPEPLPIPGQRGTRYWAMPEVDAFRSRRLRAAAGRGGKH